MPFNAPPNSTLSLIALGLVFVGAIVVVARYQFLSREAKDEGRPDSPKARLAELERAYYSGVMDEVEFRRIRDLLDPPSADKPSPPVQPRPSTTGAADDVIS